MFEEKVTVLFIFIVLLERHYVDVSFKRLQVLLIKPAYRNIVKVSRLKNKQRAICPLCQETKLQQLLVLI